MIRRPSGIVALAALVALVVASAPGPARAGITLGGATVQQGGDPFYIYTIEVLLDPFNTMTPASSGSAFNPLNASTDSYLTIYNVKGFSSYNGTYADPALTTPELDFSAVAKPAGSGYTPPGTIAPPAQPDTPDYGFADVSFYLLKGYPAIVNNGATPRLLGYLVIQAYLPDGVPPGLDLTYNSQAYINGTSTTSTGTIHARWVPEPSSLATLALGGALAALGVRRARRRGRPAPGAARA